MKEPENIYQKLNTAREFIRNAKVVKEGHNDYSKYDYFTPEQVEGLVATACTKVGCICITSLKADQWGIYQTLDFVNLENPDARISFELRTAEADMTATNRAQKMGGTDTYSERYIKMKAFQIKDNNLDFDSQNNTESKHMPAISSTFAKEKEQYKAKESEERVIEY